MTTLEAVNEILEAAGISPVPTYTAGDASWAAGAQRRLDKAAMDIQSDGFQSVVRKKVDLSPILYEFTNAAWTNGTRTLAETGAFADATVGQTLSITGGTGVTVGEYTIESVVNDDSVTLTTSITGGADTTGVTGEALTNQIKLPDGCLDIDTDDSDAWRNIAQLGDHLYDTDENTDQFTESVRTAYTVRFEFDCLPYKIQQYIVAVAACEFYDRYPLKNAMVYQRLLDKQTKAKVRADQFKSDLADVNILNSPHNRDLSGFGRRLARYSSSQVPASGQPL